MPTPARLLVLGGASVWTPQLVLGLAAAVPGGSIEITLYGPDAVRLAHVAAFCHVFTDGAIPCRHSIDLDAAVCEADLILNQVRIGGWVARCEDEEVPPGIGMAGDETLGIGGLRTAIRTRPFVAATAAAVARSRKQPWILNLANPTDLICRFWRECGMTRVVGLCDTPQNLIDGICGSTRLNPFDFDYLGINHMGWAMPSESAVSLLCSIPEYSGWIRAWRGVPTRWRACADQPGAVVEAQRYGLGRARQLSQLVDELRSSIEGRDPARYRALLAGRFPTWYGVVVVPLIKALAGFGDARLVLGLPNDGRLLGVPPEVEIETWVETRAGGFWPSQAFDRAGKCAGDVARLGSIRDLAYRAALDPSRESLMRLASVDSFMSSSAVDDRLAAWVRGAST